MSNFKVVVGVDVSKDYLSAAILKEESAVCFTSENNEISFEKELGKRLPKASLKDTLVAIESTGVYHLKLAYHLARSGYRVSLCNPLSTKRFAEMKLTRVKTDKKDAFLIAHYGKLEENLRPFKPKDETELLIEAKLKTLDDFQRQINILENQKSSTERQPLENVEELIKPYEKMIEALKKETKRIEKELEEISIKRYESEIRLLRSIPGIGMRMACVIVSFLQRFEGFSRAKEVTSYLGICPSPYESGKSVKRRGRISKKGNPYIRKVLYLCALSALRFNIACKELYERLLERGKAKKQALMAVANKLIRQAFGVLKSGIEYREDLAFGKER